MLDGMICRRLIIDVVHLDLLQGSSRPVVRHYLPVESARSDNPLIFSPKICGDFAILNILGKGDKEILYLLRLCKQTYRSFLISVCRLQVPLFFFIVSCSDVRNINVKWNLCQDI